jgi:hypothetical protein
MDLTIELLCNGFGFPFFLLCSRSLYCDYENALTETHNVRTRLNAEPPFLAYCFSGKAVAAGGDTSAALIAVALGHALVVAVFATAGFHISGAHMNPAVTLSLCVGGHITLLKSAFFVVAQMLGSSLACLLLRALTGGEVRPTFLRVTNTFPICHIN